MLLYSGKSNNDRPFCIHYYFQNKHRFSITQRVSSCYSKLFNILILIYLIYKHKLMFNMLHSENNCNLWFMQYCLCCNLLRKLLRWVFKIDHITWHTLFTPCCLRGLYQPFSCYSNLHQAIEVSLGNVYKFHTVWEIKSMHDYFSLVTLDSFNNGIFFAKCCENY